MTKVTKIVIAKNVKMIVSFEEVVIMPLVNVPPRWANAVTVLKKL